MFSCFAFPIVRDVSTPLDMTRKVSPAIFLIVVAFSQPGFAQESPSPTSSAIPTSSPTPEQTGSPSPARSVRISFIPPPMDGTISLGIFDSNRKLVRVLHREAKIDNFTIDETSLSTTWDGKNDAGENLPPGKYHARGYMVGDLKIQETNRSEEPVFVNPPDSVPVKLVTNPLTSDTRSVVDITAGLDRENAYLKTTDGLPLRTITRTEDIPDDVTLPQASVALTQASDKSLTLFFRQGQTTHEFRITGAENMMAFDCGDFQLK
jgi:hypothetical protein